MSRWWRKRLGVEPSLPAKRRATGFEDREGHRAPFASLIQATFLTGYQTRRKVPLPECDLMRSLVLSALLLTMPFSGMRVICVETAASVDTASDCERLCARHHVSGSTDGSNCMLTADACALVAFASTISVGPEPPPADLTLDVSVAHADPPRGGVEPELARLVPPPKPPIHR